jgi:hypothetical protein
MTIDQVAGSSHLVEQALDRFIASYHSLSPVNATFTGVHDYDTELPDWSPDGLVRIADELHAEHQMLTACGAAAEDTPVGDPRRVDLELARGVLEIQLAELEGTHFYHGNPALYTGEAVFSVISLMLPDSSAGALPTRAIAERLRKIPVFLAGGMAAIHLRPLPRLWLARALNECRAAERLLLEGLPLWCDTRQTSETEWKTLRAAAREALVGFATFGDWLAHRFPAPPGAAACGEEFLYLLMERGHWEERHPEMLLRQAQAELEPASAQLDTLARKTLPGGWAAVRSALARRHPTADNYLAAFHEQWEACRARVEELRLLTWPDSPIRYVPIPPWARDAARSLSSQSYRAPPPFRRAEAMDYLVPPIDDASNSTEQERRLRTVNDSVIKLHHVIHNGGVGHHVRTYYAHRAASRIGQIAAVDCASRIGMFCAGTMAEGWACYAADLMEEAGFLTPAERVVQQHARVHQLARAVVDISVHTGRMTEMDAVKFHMRQSGMRREEARNEVTRTTMFPGTAVTSWLGSGTIHQLRKERSSTEGSTFSLQVFHDGLLSFGSLPVTVIAELMRPETGP